MSDLKNIDLTEGRKMSHSNLSRITTKTENILSRLRGETSDENITTVKFSRNDVIQSLSNWSIIENTTSTITYSNSNDVWIYSGNNELIGTGTTTSTIYSNFNRMIFFDYDDHEDILSRFRDKTYTVYSSNSLMSRLKEKDMLHMESSIDQLESPNRSKLQLYFDHDDSIIERLRYNENNKEHRSSFYDNDDKLKSIPFLRRLYSTNLGRSFDKTEFNLDMVISKERFNEYIEGTEYSLLEEEPIKLDKGEINTWINSTITIPQNLATTLNFFA